MSTLPTDWPPKFQPHDRVIDLLIGPQLYTSVDSAIRELLQNAEDACALNSVAAPTGFVPRITVSYSAAENWCEIRDNGLGMNREAIQGSYAWIGAPKGEVAHIRELLSQVPADKRQIAQFGIGILSCFGVASSVELRTKMEGQESLTLKVDDFHKPFVEMPSETLSRGTSVRLFLKPDGPMKAADVPNAVRRYARHAPHVVLRDADTGSEDPVTETWLPLEASEFRTDQLTDQGVLKGRLGLDGAWLSTDGGFGAELTTCNGGFLVSDKDRDLLPANATGFRGEVDLVPGALTILMNREAFTRDAQWQELSARLGVVYAALLSQLLNRYEQLVQADKGPGPAVERGVLLLARGSVNGLLDEPSRVRVTALIPRVVHITDRNGKQMSLKTLLEKAGKGTTIYYVREDAAQQQTRLAITDTGSDAAIQVTESVNTLSLRVLQLQANGHIVVSCRQRTIPHLSASGQHNVVVHDVDLLTEAAQAAGVIIQSVNDAPAEAVALAPLPESALIRDVLEAGDSLRIVFLPNTPDRVIRDYSGRLINAAHPDIQALLKAIPAAAGNPVLRTLVQAFVDLEAWDHNRARDRLKSLLDDPELAEKAQLASSPFLRQYLEKRLAHLQRGKETKNDE